MSNINAISLLLGARALCMGAYLLPWQVRLLFRV